MIFTLQKPSIMLAHRLFYSLFVLWHILIKGYKRQILY